MRYIKQRRRAFYASLLTSGNLNGYLADINEEAEEMFSLLAKQLSACDDITEQRKIENQLEWVRRKTACHEQAREIVNVELIYV